MRKYRVILLYGVSGAGNTVLAKALQTRLATPSLSVCIDRFEGIAPAGFEAGGEFVWQTVFDAMMSGFNHSLAALARCGNNRILDHVLVEDEDPRKWINFVLNDEMEYREDICISSTDS